MEKGRVLLYNQSILAISALAFIGQLFYYCLLGKEILAIGILKSIYGSVFVLLFLFIIKKHTYKRGLAQLLEQYGFSRQGRDYQGIYQGVPVSILVQVGIQPQMTRFIATIPNPAGKEILPEQFPNYFSPEINNELSKVANRSIFKTYSLPIYTIDIDREMIRVQFLVNPNFSTVFSDMKPDEFRKCLDFIHAVYVELGNK